MIYLLEFAQGFIAFISPCMLPLIPLYASYFAGDDSGKRGRVLVNSIAFVLGFSIVFVTLGLFAATIGEFVIDNIFYINIVLGIVVILFGLNYMGVINLPIFGRGISVSQRSKPTSVIRAFVFGLIFSLGGCPCVHTFLSSALTLAVTSGDRLQGLFMLAAFSAGLGIPFIVTAMIIGKMKSFFAFMEDNHGKMHKIAGGFLVVMGVLMATGVLHNFIEYIEGFAH